MSFLVHWLNLRERKSSHLKKRATTPRFNKKKLLKIGHDFFLENKSHGGQVCSKCPHIHNRQSYIYHYEMYPTKNSLNSLPPPHIIGSQSLLNVSRKVFLVSLVVFLRQVPHVVCNVTPENILTEFVSVQLFRFSIETNQTRSANKKREASLKNTKRITKNLSV